MLYMQLELDWDKKNWAGHQVGTVVVGLVLSCPAAWDN